MIILKVNTNSLLDLIDAINRIRRDINVHSWCVTRDWDSTHAEGGVIAFFDRDGLRVAEIREWDRRADKT